MQNIMRPVSSKKQISSHNQTLTRLRHQRLRKNISLLGEPDIITVTRIKTVSSFFSKQKKTQQTSEYFINGIVFPTTAHFSTYISSKYQNVDSKTSSLSIKAKLIMFDAFQQKDVHVEINIPGSLEVKVFNLSGQALKPQQDDYERAYFSSYLRSLKPMNYPNIVLSPYIYKVDTHKQVLRKLIPFCFENSLRQLRYEIRPIYTSRLESQYPGNFVLEIIINFITKNNFWNLVDVLMTQLEKISQTIELNDLQHLKHRLLFLKKQYPKIVAYSSELLASNPGLLQWKEIQIQSLVKLKNFKLVKILGDHLIRHGGTHPRIYELICTSYLQTKDFNQFLKVLNSILTLYNEEQVYIENVSHKTKRLYFMDIAFTKGQNISAYPELCFEFDNDFLNRQNKVTQYKNSLSDSSSQLTQMSIKQQPIIEVLQLIERIDQSLEYVLQLNDSNENFESNLNIRSFYGLLVKFQKLKGWGQVIKHRGECFWLQSDFRNQEQQILQHSILLNSTTSLNSSTAKKQMQKSTTSFESGSKQTSSKKNTESFSSKQVKNFNSVELQEMQLDIEQPEQFQCGDLSSQDDEQQIEDMPACSKRVSHNANTARRKFFALKKTSNYEHIKVLCSLTLEKLFVSLFEDLKLQMQLQKWAGKLNFTKISQLSADKKQLIAILFLKKAFLHLKLQRYRKCQEALKVARRISQSILVLLVSSYQLIQLYMKNNSMKGVQFYIVDLIKIFNTYGIKKFDIVPQWAKEIITYIVEYQGIGIISKLAGPFKQLLVRWLRNNHTQGSLLKKDSTNTNQAMYKISS